MGSRVRLGVLILPEHAGASAGQVWRRAEELGFDHGWTLDHLSWRTLRGKPWFDAMTTLAVAAGATERMTLGTLVATPNFRHPVLTAAQARALDHASGGRFVLGIGAGAPGSDSTALGGPELSPAARSGRFREFVTLVDTLLRNEVTNFEGNFFAARDVCFAPPCVQQPRLPIAIAATGARGMRLAAEFADTWITIGDATEPGGQSEEDAFRTLREQLDRLDEACRDRGRDPATLRRLVNLSRLVPAPYRSPGRLTELVGRSVELGFTDVLLAYPRAEGVFAGDPVQFDTAVTQVRAAAA